DHESHSREVSRCPARSDGKPLIWRENRAMPPSRLPGTLRVLLAASFVSSIGGGLTLPFLVIYLHQVRHISLGIAGLLIGGVAVLALPVAPSAGALVDRFGARIVLLVALVVEGLGIVSLVTI